VIVFLSRKISLASLDFENGELRVKDYLPENVVQLEREVLKDIFVVN